MPSFSLQGWHPLSRTPISSFLQTTLLSAGVHGNVSDHSFRIGAATTAPSPGIPDHLIKTKGHRSSKAYKNYYLLYVCSLVDNVRCLSTPLPSFAECRQIRAFLSRLCLPPAISLLTLWALASKAWHEGSWLGCQDLPAIGAVFFEELAANKGSSWISQAHNLYSTRWLLKVYLSQ